MDLTVTDVKNIASAVVAQAVNDWRALIRGKKPTAHCNFAELRDFFRSEYCDLLLSPFPSLDGDTLLKMLQEELKNALNERKLFFT